jgi:RNA polymerase sigma-70 factor (ECF subfamily)
MERRSAAAPLSHLDPDGAIADPTALDRAWREHRRHVLDIAFRMLGNLAEAEDAAQEAFIRLVRADLDEIDNVGGWLVVVVSRICLDRLRSRRRHPTDSDSTLGDRADQSARTPDPADRITLDDNVRLALHVMLERLSAAERTAFVLHDVFQYPFEAIAEIVGRTPAACRQLASRARRTIREDSGPARFVVEPAEQRRITEQFIAACSNGDVEALLAVLDPDVDGDADLAARPFRGPTNIARGAMLFLGPESGNTLLSLPGAGGPMVIAWRDGAVVAVVSLTIVEGRIRHIESIARPESLGPANEILGA